MSTENNKNLLIKLIDEIPESKIPEVIDSIMPLKKSNSKHDQEFKELMYASESSMDFWDNGIDDEIWNNV